MSPVERSRQLQLNHTLSEFSMRDLNMSAHSDGDPRRRINVIQNNSDIRRFESKMSQMSPISNKQSLASPVIMTESSTHDLANPLLHEDWVRQLLLKDADKLVHEGKLT